MSADGPPPVDSTEWLAAWDVPEDQRYEVSQQRKQDWWERNVGGKKRISTYDDERFSTESSSETHYFPQFGKRGGRYRVRYNKQGMPYRDYY